MTTIPIIDREIFFGDPTISQAQLSPDGDFVSCVRPLNGVRNIWLKRKNESFDLAYPITKDERPITGYFWSKDGKYILYVQDKNGDENYCIYRVLVADSGPNSIPDPVNITPYDEITASIERLSKLDHDLMIVGINDRDKAWHDLYQISISSGERTLLYQNVDLIGGFLFDLKDKLRLLSRPNAAGGMDILNFDTDPDQRKILLSSDIEETISPLRFLPKGKELYLLSNQGIDQDLTSLFKWNIESGDKELIHQDPENQVDISNVHFSQLSDDITSIVYSADKPRRYFFDKHIEEDVLFLEKQIEETYVGISSATADERNWLFVAFNDRDPGSVHHFDRDTKKVTFLYHPRPELPIEHLSKVEHITYQSIDGLTIPAYLTEPSDKSSKSAVVLVHGGPWARDHYGYNSYAQFLANRGHYVLQPNFRASTGFGKKFLNAGNEEWGKKMQDDITAGAGFLVSHQKSKSDRIAIMGGSYGGYATLAALAFTPEVFAAGIDIVGPSSLLTLLETIPPYWEAGRKQLYMRVGNPETEEGKKMLEERSPLFHVNKMKAPLMVVQGANDPRVKQAEADQIVVALRDQNYPVEYLVAEDEGHGFRDPINNMAMLASIEKFLAEHIGGRYQEFMPEHVAARLKRMTKNIQEVTI